MGVIYIESGGLSVHLHRNRGDTLKASPYVLLSQQYIIMCQLGVGNMPQNAAALVLPHY